MIRSFFRWLWAVCYPPPVLCRKCGKPTVHLDTLCTSCWWDDPDG